MRKNDDIIAIYSRKSKFTGKGESIGNQVELCKEYVRVHYGDTAVDKVAVYEDEGFSGGNLNRPDFKIMMDAAKKRKFKAIIVYRLDRISRNISDFASLIEELARLDISFVSIKEQFDTSTPMGRAMMYIASVFSQLERETIAERIRDNMHELAKTGRWLGGTTPTGYASEAVKSITIDGKSKKACKLKLIPEEADIVRMIYDLYIETDSLTLTEAALIKQGIKTKNNNYFTRFSIKAILQNPVYMIADEDAYNFFIQNDTDLFSEKDAFDNKHGIMAYNRTDQEKGRATKYLPASEWIVSVGKHPGLVLGKVWVQIQESLERNKSKSFRKPRSNEALLTGLLFCSCGERMYPKMSKRKTADGKVIYTYVCKMKERSQRSVCNSKNANGNTLDMAVIEQIKMLAEDRDTFIAQLEQSRRFYTGNRMDYEQRLDDMRKETADTEKKINSLVDSLVDMGDSPAKAHVTKRIEQLNEEYQSLEKRIQELEGLTTQHALSDIEFDLMRQLLTVFKDGIDEMTIEQKRAAIRTIVRKVIWDGVNAHVVLFGVQDDEIEYPEIASVASDNTDDEDENEELVAFSDVDYEDDDTEDDRLGKTNPLSASKTHWGENSKCYPLTDAFMVPNQSPQSRKEPKWRILTQVSENMYILCSTLDGCVRYAPMYIHSFRLIAPHRLLEAQLFNQHYQNYEDIPNVPDRLRWCRHHMGLMQKEVAELIGISRGHYIDFEVGYVDYYPKEIVDKLAELYGVPVDDLLDDYNRFLYKGQGKMIREYRESLGLKKKPFARLMGISPNLLRAWEDHQKRMNINSWNKYFKGKIKA